LTGALGVYTCDTIEFKTCLLAVRILAVGPGFKIASQNTTPPTQSQTMPLSFKNYSCPNHRKNRAGANLH
jgi:hypothetical protein